MRDGRLVQLTAGDAGARNAKTRHSHMPLQRLQDTPVRELAHGLHAQVLHGHLLLTVGDDEYDLTPGMTAFIPSGVPRHAFAPEACLVIDCFTPVREDLR